MRRATTRRRARGTGWRLTLCAAGALALTAMAAAQGLPVTGGGAEVNNLVSVSFAPHRTIPVPGRAAVPEPTATIVNKGRTGMVAFVLVTTGANGGPGHKTIVDATLSPPHQAIAPGESFPVTVPYRPGEDLAALQPRVTAVLFANMSGYGDPAALATLRTQRRCAFEGAGRVEEWLRGALRSNLDEAAILKHLRQEQAAVRGGRDAAICKSAEGYALQLAIVNLEQDRVNGAPGTPKQILPRVFPMLDAFRREAQPF